MAQKEKKSYAGNPHVRFDEGEVASAATSRRETLLWRGALLYKKIAILIMVYIVFLTMQLVADTYSDWQSNLKGERETTSVSVGHDVWSDSDTDKSLPYTFPSGAVLHHTLGGYRLDLINAVIDGGITADGDLGICLIGKSFISGDILSVYGNLLIYGSGELTIIDCYNGIKAARSISVCAGPSITIGDGGTGMYAAEGPVLLSLCTISMYDVSIGIQTCGNINILGSAVAISTDSSQGLLSTGSDAVTMIDGSVVNVLSKHNCMQTDGGTLLVMHSYFVGVSSGASVVSAPSVSFDNCMAKFVSKDSNCIYADTVTIGEGDYYLATGSGIVDETEFKHSLAAIEAVTNHLKGGSIMICAPKSIGIRADSLCQIDSGRLEMVDTVNMRDLLVYNAALAVAYTGVLGSDTVDVSSLAMNFYIHDLMDALSDGRISDLEGTAWAGVFVPWEWSVLNVMWGWKTRRYIQNGGTVWCDKTLYGILAEDPIVNGGSCKSIFTQTEYEFVLHDHAKVVYTNMPISVSGGVTNRNLKCVTHKVSGAKKYDKITSGFSGIVPSYYGTSSLYADNEGKLYFWIPGTDSESGGSSDGDSSGGGSGYGDTSDSGDVSDDDGSDGDSSDGGYSGGSDGSDGGETQQVWTVTFNAYGGVVVEATRMVTSGAAVGTLPTPTRSGYTFTGWFTAASGGTQISTSTKVTVNVTYYAHWMAIQVPIPDPEPESDPTTNPTLTNAVDEVTYAGEVDTAFAKAQTIDGALYKSDVIVGTMQVKVGKISKNGIVKVSAMASLLLDGKVKKVTAKAVNVTLDATGRVPPTKVVFKEPIREMTFEMEADGSFTLKNGSYLMAEAKIGGALNGGAYGTFGIEDFNLSVPGILLDELLPDGEPFEVSRGKWKFAKAATVKWVKPKRGAEHSDHYDDASGKDLIIDTSKGKSNLSGLKLTYTTKTGQFKGSFKVYALQGGGSPGTARPTKMKLVKYTVNVIGFVVDGVGYGEASCKKPAATWSLTVE